MGYYHMAFILGFFPAVCSNFFAQVGYYLFMNRYMFLRNVPLFYFPRVFLFYGMFHIAHEEIFMKQYFSQSYHININDLFDQDEPFLFQSMQFKLLIKRMHDRHTSLINPNFDLSPVVQDPDLLIAAHAEPAGRKKHPPRHFTSSDVISYFNNTFNSKGRYRHNPYQRMVDSY